MYEKLFPGYKKVVKNPPLNLKKRLHERFPGKVQFEKAISSVHCVSVICKIEMKPETEPGIWRKFRGLGNNKKSAVMAASKCALRKT